jgi:hypothetical protein
MLYFKFDRWQQETVSTNNQLKDLVQSSVALLRCVTEIPSFDFMSTGLADDLVTIVSDLICDYENRLSVHPHDVSKLLVAMVALTTAISTHLLEEVSL